LFLSGSEGLNSEGESVSRRIAVATLIVILGSIPTASAQDDHPGAAPYAQVCGMCHGEAGKGDIAPPLVPGRFDPEYVLAIVREGYGQMPPISSRELTDDQVRQIVEYLASVGEEGSDPPASAPAGRK